MSIWWIRSKKNSRSIASCRRAARSLARVGNPLQQSPGAKARRRQAVDGQQSHLTTESTANHDVDAGVDVDGDQEMLDVDQDRAPEDDEGDDESGGMEDELEEDELADDDDDVEETEPLEDAMAVEQVELRKDERSSDLKPEEDFESEG